MAGFAVIICGIALKDQRSSAYLHLAIGCLIAGAALLLFGLLRENFRDQQHTAVRRADIALTIIWITALFTHTAFNFSIGWIIASCAILAQLVLRYISRTKQ